MTDRPVEPAAVQPVAPPPGWYGYQGVQRWWDGTQWTDHFQSAVIAPVPTFVPPPHIETNALAVAALVLGICATAFEWMGPLSVGLVLAFVPGTLALIFGFVSLKRSAKLNGLRRRTALAGVILGFAPIVIFIGRGIVLGIHAASH